MGDGRNFQRSLYVCAVQNWIRYYRIHAVNGNGSGTSVVVSFNTRYQVLFLRLDIQPTCDLRTVNNDMCEQYIQTICYWTDTVIKHVTSQTKRGEWQKCFEMLLEIFKFWLSSFLVNSPLWSRSDLNSWNLLLVWYVSLIFSTSPPEIWRDKCAVIILNNSNDLNSI